VRQQDDYGSGDGAGVGDRDLGGENAELAGPLARPAVEANARFAAGLAADLDLPEGEPSPSGAQRLHRRLLGRESSGHVLSEGRRIPAARENLARPKDPGEEPLRVALQDSGDPIDFGEVESDEKIRNPAQASPSD
jgi:hypothetical protein